ncbi:hypothetical protein MOV08_17735 [Streptomyces yunnanensis]|uniref:DUF7848 domain-containing protein n=1 Tax=Streptomyces yunnanensis TaxID=156453 RepID=A0ABY8A8B7_9ACTN|nr:hypothetical protein [Streptomyces yunnanensis]WEB40939.1 hypothetical protein MOV08_17735 [Streptomyces yunnanensis]
MSERKGLQEWTLQIDPEWGLRHMGKCIICGAFSLDTPNASEARDWCLKHAHATGDDSFKLMAIHYGSAIFAEPPSVNGTSPT